jgi:lipopolysaccharide assembly protein A
VRVGAASTWDSDRRVESQSSSLTYFLPFTFHRFFSKTYSFHFLAVPCTNHGFAVSYNVLVKALQYLQVLILVALLAYLGWFHLSNPFPVSFPVPFIGAIPFSASMALLGGLLAGLLYALLLFAPHLIRRSNLIRRQNRKIRDLEAQVTKLQPLTSAPVIPDRTSSSQQDQTPDQTLAQMREKGML